jgi:hypothetical protein
MLINQKKKIKDNFLFFSPTEQQRRELAAIVYVRDIILIK